MESASVIGLLLDVTINGKTSEQYVYGQSGQQGNPTMLQEGNTQMAISYGAKPVVVHLNKTERFYYGQISRHQ